MKKFLSLLLVGVLMTGIWTIPAAAEASQAEYVATEAIQEKTVEDVKTEIDELPLPEPVTEINLEADGICRISAEYYQLPSNAREFKAAVWSSENDQDDLKWYDLVKKDGNFSLELDLVEHGSGNGEYRIRLYYRSKENKLICFEDKEFLVEDIFDEEGNIQEPEEDSPMTKDPETMVGYTEELISDEGIITLRAVNIAELLKASEVMASFWSDEKGQDDMIWYPLSLKEEDTGDLVWSADVDIAKHATGDGIFNIHYYYRNKQGKAVCFSTGRVQVDLTPKDEGNASFNRSTGTFKVTYTNGEGNDGIEKVVAAVWADAKQADLEWYTMSLNEDGKWTYSGNIKKHNYRTGIYQVHFYVDYTSGSSRCAFKTSFQADVRLTAVFSYLDRLTDNGSFGVAADISCCCPINSVSFKVRNLTNPADVQEDLSAEKQEDGRWAAVVNLGHHGYLTGEYEIICTAELSDGTKLSAEPVSYLCNLDGALYTVVNSEESATVIIRGYQEAEEVKTAVWSINGGKDDLRYYIAERWEDGWKIEIPKSNHGSAGIYRLDLYVNGEYAATDQFSFDAYRYADSWYGISVAHAAGGQGSQRSDIYTNCLSAMDVSYVNGYRCFEIDVLLTSDSKPVLFHTWNTTPILDHYTYSTEKANGPTYKEFMSDTMYGGKYATADFANLMDYLIKHPDVKVLLDTKYRSDADIENLYSILKREAERMNALGVFQTQVVPYFFTTGNYSAINRVMSFKEYHYATYASYPKKIGSFQSNEFRTVLQFCKMNRVLSVSMWDCLATKELIQMADSFGITVYVHTTDDTQTAERMLKMGAAGIIGNTIDPVQALGLVS